MEQVDARTDVYSLGKLLEYIEEKSECKLPKHLSQIKERCLNEDKTKRYETVDDIIKLLNKKKQKTWFIIATIVAIIFSTIGWQWFKTTEEHKQLVLNLNSDAKIEGIFYKIVSEDSRTCKVIGKQKDTTNLYIMENVNIDGKTYKTTEIVDSAFCGRTEIKSANLPRSLRRIGEKAFCGCNTLATATIPEGITTIERKCFYESGIKYLKLPSTLKVIGQAAFARCRLEEVVIPEGVTTLELDAFGDCDSLVTVELPSTLKAINRGVFWSCTSLEEISIPASVETIGEYAFYYCSKLKHIYNYSPEPQSLSRIIRKNDVANVTLHVPAGSVEKYRKAYHWRDMEIKGDL